MHGYIGDQAENLEIRCYTDADLAGDKLTKKSTTGVFVVLIGPNSYFPLVGVSTKQTAVSHASTESELVGADHGVRKECLPLWTLWETLLQKTRKRADGSTGPGLHSFAFMSGYFLIVESIPHKYVC